MHDPSRGLRFSCLTHPHLSPEPTGEGCYFDSFALLSYFHAHVRGFTDTARTKEQPYVEALVVRPRRSTWRTRGSSLVIFVRCLL
jgi:hypothetical protein